MSVGVLRSTQFIDCDTVYGYWKDHCHLQQQEVEVKLWLPSYKVTSLQSHTKIYGYSVWVRSAAGA